MKRFLSIALSLAMALSFTGCTGAARALGKVAGSYLDAQREQTDSETDKEIVPAEDEMPDKEKIPQKEENPLRSKVIGNKLVNETLGIEINPPMDMTIYAGDDVKWFFGEDMSEEGIIYDAFIKNEAGSETVSVMFIETEESYSSAEWAEEMMLGDYEDGWELLKYGETTVNGRELVGYTMQNISEDVILGRCQLVMALDNYLAVIIYDTFNDDDPADFEDMVSEYYKEG